MNNIAGRLNTILEMYNSGLLCSCNAIDYGFDYNIVTGDKIVKEIIIHRVNCEAPSKVKELLDAADS